MYDIIFISEYKSGINRLRDRFPLAKYAKDLTEAKSKSFTNMFWAVWDDLIIDDNFKFDYCVNPWDQEYIHVFKNGDIFDGVCLIPKTAAISDREFKYRFFLNKKDIDICASKSINSYDRFIIDSYDEYLYALENSTTEMFWMLSRNIQPVEDFKFNLYFTTRTNEFIQDRHVNHAFIHEEDGNQTYDGIFLLSKAVPLTKKEIEFRFPVNRKEWDIVASTPKLYDIFVIDTYEEYLTALETTTTEMFWMTSSDIVPSLDFKFNLYFSKKNNEYDFDRTCNHAFIHEEDGKQSYDGIFLCSKHVPLTKKEIEHRFPVNRKEWDIVASTPKLYDIFVIDTYEEYLTALETTTTEMFWMTSKYINILPEFKFDLHFSKKNHEYDYDRTINHAFIHEEDGKETYSGIFLLNKHVLLSKKEIEHRFPVNRKEWDIVASTPKLYDIFVIDTYEEYLTALENSTTEMFWMTSSDIVPSLDFKFNLYFSKKNHEYDYDRTINHAFIHEEDGKQSYDGIFLLSKIAILSKKEIEHRFPVDRKEWDIVASTPKLYDIFVIDTYEEYLTALETTTTEMFWMTSNNLTINENFKFNLYFSKKNHEYDYDRTINHAFIHRVNGMDSYNGVFLLNKNIILTKKEIEFRFPVNRKEWNIVASGPTVYSIYED